MVVMHNGVDAVSPTEAMRRDAQPMAALYFIMFMMVGHLFVVNLFVGIILDNFTKEADSGGDDMGSLTLMTDEQRGWVREHRKINFMRAPVQYEPPAAPWRKRVHVLATSRAMEYAMLICIIINAVFMGVEHYRMSNMLEQVRASRAFAACPPLPSPAPVGGNRCMQFMVEIKSKPLRSIGASWNASIKSLGEFPGYGMTVAGKHAQQPHAQARNRRCRTHPSYA